MLRCLRVACISMQYVARSVGLPRGVTVDGSRNPGEPQSLCGTASPSARPSLFPCAANKEVASRPGNIAAALV